MLVLIIILLVFALLFNIYASVDLRYSDGEFHCRVKYLFINIFSSDRPKKEKKKKPPEKKKAESRKTEEEDEKEKNGKKSGKKKKPARKKSVIKEYIGNLSAVVDFIRSSLNDVLGLTRKIRVSRVCVDCLVADEDAYSCALNYGVLSAGVYNILAFISSYFTTDIDHVNIDLKYNEDSKSSVYGFSTRLKLKPGSVIIAGIGILISFIKLQIFKEKDKEKTNNTVPKEKRNMENHPVNNLMGTAIEKIREMIDVNTIIGNPITTSEGATIIPVSKVSFGFASGGSDLPSKQPKELFGGAAGAGVSVQPLAFICVSPDGDVKLLQMSVNATKENAMISTLPDIIDKFSGLVNGGEKKEKPERQAKVKKHAAKKTKVQTVDDYEDAAEDVDDFEEFSN